MILPKTLKELNGKTHISIMASVKHAVKAMQHAGVLVALDVDALFSWCYFWCSINQRDSKTNMTRLRNDRLSNISSNKHKFALSTVIMRYCNYQ